MVAQARVDRGKRAHLSGLSAEEAVARDYDRRGLAICARRWRGTHGEIDLIVRNGAQVVLVEVKKSRSHDEAMAHLTAAQVDRIFWTAAEFVEGEPQGGLTDLRFDLALVDAMGRVVVHENFWVN